MSEETVLVYEDDHVEPPASTLLVLGLDVAFLGAIGVALWQRSRARDAIAAAEACVIPNAPLFERQRFLAGTVELASGEPTAARVTVTQAGIERAVKNGTTHDWVETDRRVEARPFYVRHASGARVRVEPPADADDVLLVDQLDQLEHVERSVRRRRAELTPGERVIVEGRLAREVDPEAEGAQSYRASSQGWVMRPRRDGKMQMSSEDLAHKHRLRVRALGGTLVLLALAWVVAQTPLLTYRLRQLRGRDVVATYGGKRDFWSMNAKGHRVEHRVVDYVDDSRGVPTDESAEVDLRDYYRVPNGPGTIRVRQVRTAPYATALGRGASVKSWALLGAAFVCALAWLKLRATLAHKRWYERELDDRGNTGPLPLPSGARLREAAPPAPPAPPGPPRGASPPVGPVR